jgi:hypothetical protein
VKPEITITQLQRDLPFTPPSPLPSQRTLTQKSDVEPSTTHLAYEPHPGKLRHDLPFTPPSPPPSQRIFAQESNAKPSSEITTKHLPHPAPPTTPAKGLNSRTRNSPDLPQFGNAIESQPWVTYNTESGDIEVEHDDGSVHKIPFQRCVITHTGCLPQYETDNIKVHLLTPGFVVAKCTARVPYVVAQSRLAGLPKLPQWTEASERDSNLYWFNRYV